MQEVLLSKEVWVLIGQRFASFDIFQRARTLAQLADFIVTGRVERTDDVNPFDLYAEARENIHTLSCMQTTREVISK
jgi:hypothetical protein